MKLKKKTMKKSRKKNQTFKRRNWQKLPKLNKKKLRMKIQANSG
jgi:hypothetical protein